MQQFLEVKFSDGTVWHIPAEFIAKDRAAYFAKLDVERGDADNYEVAFAAEVAHALRDEYEICDWAANKMNWSDVEDVAEPISRDVPDYDREWTNADRRTVEIDLPTEDESAADEQ